MAKGEGSIFLHCQNSHSNKDYWIERYESSGNFMWRIRYGPAGRATNTQEKGVYSQGGHAQALKLLNDKIGKGYEVMTVNSKPCLSQSVSVALSAFENDGNAANQAMHPVRAIVAKDVIVTFDPGQLAPVW